MTTVGQSAYAATPCEMTRPSTNAERPAEPATRKDSTRNWKQMSRRSGADRAAHADLARLLEHRGEHDVHDADAADEQRDAGDAAHHDVEELLRLAALGEQGLRARPARSRRRRRAADRAAPAITAPVSSAGALAVELDDDLGERRRQRVAIELAQRGRKRHVDVVLRRRDRDACRRTRRASGESTPMTSQPHVVDLDDAAERLAGAEQIAAHAGADHAHLGVMVSSSSASKKRPSPQRERVDLAVAVRRTPKTLAPWS